MQSREEQIKIWYYSKSDTLVRCVNYCHDSFQEEVQKLLSKYEDKLVMCRGELENAHTEREFSLGAEMYTLNSITNDLRKILKKVSK